MRTRKPCLRSLREQRVGCLDERAGGVDDVVEDEAGTAADVADDVHHFGDVDIGAALVDNGQRNFKLLGERTGRALRRRRPVKPRSGSAG